jgi:hypothetical protein
MDMQVDKIAHGPIVAVFPASSKRGPGADPGCGPGVLRRATPGLPGGIVFFLAESSILSRKAGRDARRLRRLLFKNLEFLNKL